MTRIVNALVTTTIRFVKCSRAVQQFVRSSTVFFGRTVLHDLSFLDIRRTMQIGSRPTEIIIYFWKQSGDLRGG